MNSSLDEALQAVERALSPLKGSYMLIGGLAVVLRGFPTKLYPQEWTIVDRSGLWWTGLGRTMN